MDYMGIIVDCGQWTIGAVVDYMGIAAMYDMSQIVQWMDYTGFGYHNWAIRDFLLDYNGRTFGLYGPHMNEWPPIGKIAAHSAYDMFHGISTRLLVWFFPTSVFGVGIFF